MKGLIVRLALSALLTFTAAGQPGVGVWTAATIRAQLTEGTPDATIAREIGRHSITVTRAELAGLERAGLGPLSAKALAAKIPPVERPPVKKAKTPEKTPSPKTVAEVPPPPPAPVAANLPTIHTNGGTACVASKGAVYCWGRSLRSCDDTRTAQPKRFESPSALSSFSLTTDGACGVGADQKLYCVGRSYNGALLGYGDSLGDSYFTRVGDESWRVFRRGEFQSCGQRTDGTVVCLGYLFVPVAPGHGYPRKTGTAAARPVDGIGSGVFRDVRLDAYAALFLMDDGRLLAADWASDKDDRAQLRAGVLFPGHLFTGVRVGTYGTYSIICAGKDSGSALCRSSGGSDMTLDMGNARLAAMYTRNLVAIDKDGSGLTVVRFANGQAEPPKRQTAVDLGFPQGEPIVDADRSGGCIVAVGASGSVRAFVLDDNGDQLRPYTAASKCLGPPAAEPWKK